MEEIFKDVVGYEEFYQVSNLGNFWSKTSNRLLKLTKERGYNVVFGCANGKKKKFRVHLEMGRAFLPNPENKPLINHIDTNKSNNVLWNLEWMTVQENTKHAYDNGLIKLPKRKLNESISAE